MPFLSCSYAAATYQPKLLDCDGNPLPAGTEMATCADLAGLSIADATDTTKGKVALNAGTSLPGDATNCTDALTACGLNALLADATVGGNAVINGVKALIPLATTTVAGLIEESTGEETRLGATDPNRADRAVTPESMSYALQTGQVYPLAISWDNVPVASAQFAAARFINSGTTGVFRQGIRGEVLDATGSAGQGATAGVVGIISGGTLPTDTAGVYGYIAPATVTPSAGASVATYGLHSGSGDGRKIGTSGAASGPGGTNIGVYGAAANGATNWAGFFEGNTYTSGNAHVGIPSVEPWGRPANIGGKGLTLQTGNGSLVELNMGVVNRDLGISSNSAGNGINSRNGIALNLATDDNTRAFITNTGVTSLVTVTAPSYITSSDSTLKENVEDIDPAKALQFRNGLRWVSYEMFSEQQVEIMEEVTEEVQKTDAEGNPVVDEEGNAVMETLTKQVPTGRYEVKRNSLGKKRGLIAQEVQALAASIGDFSDVVAVVGEYFTLDAQGYPVKDAQGKNIVNKRLGLDYDAIQFLIAAAEQSLLVKA